MNGLEILLFGAFVIFAVVNLLVRFLVRKARGKGKAGAVQIDASMSLDKSRFSPAMGTGAEGGTEEEPKVETVNVSGGRTIPEETEKEVDYSAAAGKQPGLGTGIEEQTRRFRGTIETRKDKEIHHETFWERVDELPPLQRAIVLAEVLGKSRGIDS